MAFALAPPVARPRATNALQLQPVHVGAACRAAAVAAAPSPAPHNAGGRTFSLRPARAFNAVGRGWRLSISALPSVRGPSVVQIRPLEISAAQIALDNILKRYPGVDLLEDVSVALKPGMRLGLVGPNGAGKSTLIKIIIGEIKPDAGSITKERGLRIGYLPQDLPTETSDRSILDEVISGVGILEEVEAEMIKVSHEIAERPDDKKLYNRLSELQHDFDRLQGMNPRGLAERILLGLGFKPSELEMPVSKFSGGWRMRVSLSRLLLMEPELLIMDEPTNHLDLEACIWLESFLSEWKGALLLISHDRAFLNKSVNYIAELERGKLTLYTGDFDKYEETKSARRAQVEATAAAQQRAIEKKEAHIERFKAKAAFAKGVQSRIKQLEKMERVAIPTDDRKAMNMWIPQPARAPRVVMALRNISKAFGEKVIYKDQTLEIERGQKVGLVGRNGAGKSTLLKMMTKDLKPDEGRVVYGEGVDVSYFSQHQQEALDGNKTVVDTIQDVVTTWDGTKIRSYLGGFLFQGDDVFKKVMVLSGGEKARLAFAKMLVKPSSLILLDEPTNHLDMESCDVIEKALSAYEGTLVVISHDRHFLGAIANRIVETEDGQIVDYPGGYDYYELKKAIIRAQLAKEIADSLAAKEGANGAKAAAPVLKPGVSPEQAKKNREAEAKRLKKTIAKLEKDVKKDGLSAEKRADAQQKLDTARAQLAENEAATAAAAAAEAEGALQSAMAGAGSR